MKARLKPLNDPSWRKGGEGKAKENIMDNPQATYPPKSKYQTYTPPNNERTEKNRENQKR